MDSSAMSWLSEMDSDNTISLDQCILMDTIFDEEGVAVIQQVFEKCLSAENNSPPSPPSESPEMGSETAAKIQEPNKSSDLSNVQSIPVPNPDIASTTPVNLNFGNQNYPDQEQSKQPPKKTSRVRPPSQVYGHIIAERKRRELLSQQFLALSTMVSGLKKMDKTSVLGDAITYLKNLQERVKTLEEQTKKQKMESLVFVKKSEIMEDDDEGLSDEKSGSSDEQPLPEIEARIYNDHILIRIHCEKHKGVLINVLRKMEKLNLAVVSSNVSTFGGLALDITIVAEMEKNFNSTMKQVVTKLRAALQPGYLRHFITRLDDDVSFQVK